MKNITEVLCGGCSSYVLDDHRRAFVFGNNSRGQFGLHPPLRNVINAPTPVKSWDNNAIFPVGKYCIRVDEQGNLFFFGSLDGDVVSGYCSVFQGLHDEVLVFTNKSSLNDFIKRAIA
jgi:hypothetical protein